MRVHSREREARDGAWIQQAADQRERDPRRGSSLGGDCVGHDDAGAPASKERTAAQWKHLLEDRAGLKIVKIWGVGNGVESLIECELP